MQSMDVDGETIMPERFQSQLQFQLTQPSGSPVIAEGTGLFATIHVPIDDAHPFDLEAYISNYTNRNAIDRLFHIMEHCPALVEPAFRLAVERIKRGRDVGLYRVAVRLFRQVRSSTDMSADVEADVEVEVEVDEEWMERVSASNTAERNKLEVELKTYQSNMIKESIRMAHRDLGNFYRATGDYMAALKHYAKSREFCTASQHVLDMCLSVLELLIEERNYTHIPTYVFKADAALDVAASSVNNDTASGAGAGGSNLATQLKRKGAPSPERERVQRKLDVASGLAYLGQSQYERAATTFLKLGPAKGLEDWNGKIITPSDIAIYGTLCALATLSRGAIRGQLMQNEGFVQYLEQERYIRDLVEAYMGSKFKVVLELLEKYNTRHLLDIHLSPYIQELRSMIRDRALALYFQPFSTIRLQNMVDAFGLGLDEIEYHVVNLIRSGKIKGRLDSCNKILQANVTDQRAALFLRAMQMGSRIQSSNRKLLLRLRLQQVDLVIKAPKPQSQNPAQSPVPVPMEGTVDITSG